MLGSLAEAAAGQAGAPKLLAGSGADQTHLVVVATAERGLCGGFNSSIVREARRLILRLQGEGKTVNVLCVGRQGRVQPPTDFGAIIIGVVEAVAHGTPSRRDRVYH